MEVDYTEQLELGGLRRANGGSPPVDEIRKVIRQDRCLLITAVIVILITVSLVFIAQFLELRDSQTEYRHRCCRQLSRGRPSLKGNLLERAAGYWFVRSCRAASWQSPSGSTGNVFLWPTKTRLERNLTRVLKSRQGRAPMWPSGA